ncbi:hypothetical protein AgCh_020693 [Apium graveolens]
MKSIQLFSTTSDELCFEATQSEGIASNIINEQYVGTVSDVVADYVEFTELIDGQIVVVDEVADNCIQNQLNKEVVINNKNHKHIAFDQIYIDKESLKIVLAHYVNPSNESVFEIYNVDEKWTVNLATKYCTCNRFQMDQLPCAHAIAVLQKVNYNPYEYCSSYYIKQAMLAAYKELVYPVVKKDT